MAITRVQNNVNFTQKPLNEPQGNITMERLVQLPKLHYRNRTDIPDTVNNIRPERGQGHLIGNNPIKAFGRFFSNRYYDLKSVYKGYTGTANDHQLGRTNDVGLVAGGLGIAAFLATKRGAVLPKHMEFIGLGSFLASMSLWPKIGVFGPARLVHGFDVDKRYIDDQGRNKSVFQDPNYVPFDLFDGTRKSENLGAIATYMGISKDAPNREEMAKDQMVKIARQNNTLWMLSSGIAVPTMTALISNGVERLYTPYLFAKKAEKHAADLQVLYAAVKKGEDFPQTMKAPNSKGSVEKIIKGLAEKQFVTQDEVLKAINQASEGLNSEFAAEFSKTVSSKLQVANAAQVVVDEKFVTELAKNLEMKFQGHEHLKKAIISADDIKSLFKGANFEEGICVEKAELLTKIKNAGAAKLEGTPAVKTRLANLFEQNLKAGDTILPKSEKMLMTPGVQEFLQKVAAPIERYSNYFKAITNVNELQMGSDSVNANYWGKLEKAFTEIAIPDRRIGTLKGLMDNGKEIEKIVISNFEKIAKDEKLYAESINKINSLKMAYLKDILGAGNEETYTDIILGKSPNLGEWLKRVAGNSNKIDTFIEMQKIIAEDLANCIPENRFAEIVRQKVPSLEVAEQVSKMENFVSACDRMLHSLDLYKRAEQYKTSGTLTQGFEGVMREYPSAWYQELFEKAKRETVAANSNDIFLRFGYKDKPVKYHAFMKLVYDTHSESTPLHPDTIKAFKPTRLLELEKLTNLTSEQLTEKAALEKQFKSGLATTQGWIARFRYIIPDVWHNNGGLSWAVDLNWMFPGYDDGLSCNGEYLHSKLKTPDAKYKIQAKNLVELADQGIKQAHNSGKWLRTFGGLFVGVFTASVLTQFLFGKKDATIPTEKERLRDARMAARAERMEATRAN